MFEGPLRTHLNSLIPSNWHLHTPDGATVSRGCCRSWTVCRSPKSPKNP